MIKIGLDVHGVIDDLPEVFSEITRCLVAGGNEVHILTGSTHNKELEDHLKSLNIHYTHIFSLLDYHMSIQTEITYDADGRFYLDEYLWDRTKGDYCIKHNINLHLDDSDRYDSFFKTPYARFYSKNKRKHFIKKE